MDIIYNLPEIEKILTDFYILTGFRIALFNKEYQEIFAIPDRLSSFCKILRENEKLQSKCKHDDFTHFEQCKKEKTTLSYTCHAGIHEVISPLKTNGSIIGFLMVGQINCTDNHQFDVKQLEKKFVEYNLEFAKLAKEFANLSTANEEKLRAVQTIIEIYANYICTTTLAFLDKNSLAYKIDNYILENITQEITIAKLCKNFGFNKTNFYAVTNKLFGVTIMNHIKQIRIHKAKLLLSDTTLKINEIACDVGIYDYNYFTKIFKAEVKCTPREYRKNSIYGKNT